MSLATPPREILSKTAESNSGFFFWTNLCARAREILCTPASRYVINNCTACCSLNYHLFTHIISKNFCDSAWSSSSFEVTTPQTIVFYYQTNQTSLILLTIIMQRVPLILRLMAHPDRVFQTHFITVDNCASFSGFRAPASSSFGSKNDRLGISDDLSQAFLKIDRLREFQRLKTIGTN